MEPDQRKPLRVAVVGACAAGKSTLVAALRAAGYDARHVAQEHSYVPDMWRRIARPDVLVYLDVSYEAAKGRRPHMEWQPGWFAEEQRRLAHARQHCDVYVDTSWLSADEVHQQVIEALPTAY